MLDWGQIQPIENLQAQVDRYSHVFAGLSSIAPTHFEYRWGQAAAAARHVSQTAARRLAEARRDWSTCCKTILVHHAFYGFQQTPRAGLLQRLPECLRTLVIKPSLFHFSMSQHVTRENVVAEFNAFWTLREETFAKQRLKALKDNDTDAYMVHLSSLKITSLLRIMEKTHDFMTKVGATLHHKSSSSSSASGSTVVISPNAGISRDDDEYRRFKEYVASAKDEFKLVHKTEVFVESQPRGLNATLMPHQLVGLRFLVSLYCNNINGILADEMGVGKTIQTLALLLHLKETMNVRGPHLILAPLSIVREWKDACASFVGNSLKAAEFSELKAVSEAHQFDLVLMPIHRVRAFVPQLKSIKWNFVVVDEAHKAISNLNTITAQSVLQIPFLRRLVLTGTPLNSDLQELWSLLHFLNPDVFTEQESFDVVFRKPFSHVSDANDVQLTEEERELLIMRMHQVLRPFMLRRTKKDIDSTLRITFHHVKCPLTSIQKQLLNHLRTERRLPHVCDGKPSWRTVLTVESSAQLICNHPFLVPYFTQLLHHESVPEEEASRVALESSGKFIVLDSILQRMAVLKRKVVLFTHWLDCVDLLTEYFSFRGWANSYVVLTGATSADERRENVDRFRNDPECWIFLVTVKAGGCGINLQIAHMVIVLDKDYTATNEDQAIARVLRIGQRNTVRALFLLTDDPSEAKVVNIADRKDKPRKAIIEGGAYNTSAATVNENPDDAPADEDDDSRKKRLIAESLAYGTADSTIDAATAAEVAAGDNCNGPSALLGLFDSLIATETGGSDEAALASSIFDHVRGTFSPNANHPTIIRGWELLNEPEKECGRGKRERDEINLVMPTEAFWDKYHEQGGFDDDEIIRLYRKELADRERRREEKVNQMRASATANGDTNFPQALLWISLRRSTKRLIVARAMSKPDSDPEGGSSDE